MIAVTSTPGVLVSAKKLEKNGDKTSKSFMCYDGTIIGVSENTIAIIIPTTKKDTLIAQTIVESNILSFPSDLIVMIVNYLTIKSIAILPCE